MAKKKSIKYIVTPNELVGALGLYISIKHKDTFPTEESTADIAFLDDGNIEVTVKVS